MDYSRNMNSFLSLGRKDTWRNLYELKHFGVFTNVDCTTLVVVASCCRCFSFIFSYILILFLRSAMDVAVHKIALLNSLSFLPFMM